MLLSINTVTSKYRLNYYITGLVRLIQRLSAIRMEFDDSFLQFLQLNEMKNRSQRDKLIAACHYSFLKNKCNCLEDWQDINVINWSRIVEDKFTIKYIHDAFDFNVSFYTEGQSFVIKLTRDDVNQSNPIDPNKYINNHVFQKLKDLKDWLNRRVKSLKQEYELKHGNDPNNIKPEENIKQEDYQQKPLYVCTGVYSKNEDKSDGNLNTPQSIDIKKDVKPDFNIDLDF